MTIVLGILVTTSALALIGGFVWNAMTPHPEGDDGHSSRQTDFGIGGGLRLLREGNLRRARPSLLVITGLTGLLLFGSLALLVTLENKWLGGAAVVVAVLLIVTELRN